jgi:ketosteroid isomerase-like protein
MGGFHSPAQSFTRFGENPPYTRQSSEEAFVYEQAAFANTSDHTHEIDELRIDLIGEAAVCTFYPAYNGVFVNDYSFEGSPVGSRARVTVVLTKTKDGWKIAHEHLSHFPEWKASQPSR